MQTKYLDKKKKEKRVVIDGDDDQLLTVAVVIAAVVILVPSLFPPLTLFSINAVNGRKSNRSVKYFHTFGFPYFRKHSS
jgi:hypothetical protein